MRKVVDASFMGVFMMPPLTPVEDLERYFRALKRAQIDIDLAPEHQRVVFLPYSRETFESTQRWIHQRDIFETVAVCDYEAAVVA